MSRVFLVQNPKRRLENGELVNRFDVEPAAQFGELVELLSSTANPFNPGHIINELHDKLRDYSDQDYIVCIGNPVLIGWSVAIAAAYNKGVVTCLQWSGTTARYIPVPADVLLLG